ncbi:MAG: C2H2-type zinc finger protein [Oscillospiraceae bacterium]|nr:C2H2-type zinc finger protein [Oscillospiraceae bacterium]
MKKITKRLVSVSLALIMALFCIAPAFATDTCSICEATFSDIGAYAMHEKICKELHGGDAIVFYCSYCNEQYATKAALQNHLDKSHKLTIEKKGNANTCAYCNATFDKENAFNNHIQTCITTYECNNCGKSFINNYVASVHQMGCTFVADTTYTLTIQNKSNGKTVNYGDTVRIEAVVDKGVPSGCSIVYELSGSGASIETETTSDGHYYCYVKATGSGTATVTAKLCYSNGDVVVSYGNDVADSQDFTMKAGFIQKIISFFKDLFGMNRVTVQ